jgi:DNA repair exonuclease SbcCD ATPase subunit
MDQFFNMFNQLNKQFFNTLNDALKDKNTVEFKLPNGGKFHLSGNIFSDEQFQDLKNQLEEAANMNHQEKFEEIFKQIQDEINKTTANMNWDDVFKGFKGFDGFGYQNPSAPEKTDSVDEQIKKYQDEIERLQKLKAEKDAQAQKDVLINQISKLETTLDEKLGELSIHKDNEEMKKSITEELTNLHNQIRELKSKLSQL